MPEEKIVLTIDEEGGITAKTSGFKGESCLEALEEILGEGLSCTKVKKTDEFFQKELSQKKVNVTRGRG